MLFLVFTSDPGFVAGMGARGSRAVRPTPAPYISVPLISALLCFLHWYLLRPTEYPPSSCNPFSQPVLWQLHWTGSRPGPQWQSSRRPESTEFHQILKGTNSQSTHRKKKNGIICGRDVTISLTIISLDLKMSLWLISIFKDAAALNPFSSYSSHQSMCQTLHAMNSSIL